MPFRVLAISVFLMFAFSGCSQKDAEHGQAATAGKPAEHVWKEQVEALDKAKAVQQDLNAAVRRNAEAIEEQAR
jgi:hypothetical protein